MNIRLEIAKARKGLACALKEGNNVPPFCRIQLSCKLDVIDKDIYSELQEKWEKKEQSVKKDMLTEAVEFFGSKIPTLNNTMKTTLDNTKEIIGTASKKGGAEKMTINTGSKENTSKKGGVNLIKQYTVNISFKEQYIFYCLITI